MRLITTTMRLTLATVLTLVLAATLTASPAGAADGIARRDPLEWLDRLNQIRRWAGLPEVVEDPALTDDAQAAAEYLTDNDLFVHDIVDPGAPADAVRGAATSNLFGTSGAPLSQRAWIDGWTNSLGHGTWNLHPGMRQVGFGEATNPATASFQVVAALNVLGAPFADGPTGVHTFPADGVTDFDLEPSGGSHTELCGWAPSTMAGPVLRVIGGLWYTEPNEVASATLVVDGERVDACVLTADHYGALGDTDSMAIIPAAPFPVGAVVEVEATWRGAHSWSFRTAGERTVVERIAGVDRVETAIVASQDRFVDDAAGAVVLTRADSYADALAGTPLAVAKDGPLLLTWRDGLTGSTRREIDRVLAPGGTVHVLGGPAAVGAGVDAELRGAGYRVVRHAGVDRFATAVAIATDGLGSPALTFVAGGRDFRDALAAGAAAGALGGAVVLAEGAGFDASLPSTTAAYLASRGDDVHWVGDVAVLAPPGATVAAGYHPAHTAAILATQLLADAPVLGVASSSSFADALAGGAHVASMGGALLWTSPGALPTETATALARIDAATHVYVYGGTAAVSDAAAAATAAASTPRWSGDFGE